MNVSVTIGVLIPFIGTSFGAAFVFFMKRQLGRSVQRALTGFAAGVMTAASVWSLLIHAIEQSSSMGAFAFVPAVAGFWIGTLFLLVLDKTIPHLHMLDKTGTELDSALYVDIDTMKELIRAHNEKNPNQEKTIDPDSVVSSVLIKVADGYDIDDVVADINLHAR